MSPWPPLRGLGHRSGKEQVLEGLWLEGGPGDIICHQIGQEREQHGTCESGVSTTSELRVLGRSQQGRLEVKDRVGGSV